MRATMSQYLRARTGSTFFFTLVSFRRQPILCLPPIRSGLRRAVEDVRRTRPFEIDAWVLMPDHLHCIWTLPNGDVDYSTRWAIIRSSVSRFAGVVVPLTGTASPSRIKHRDSPIWQRRFYEHQIRDERDLERHVDYIHFNPVRHGHAASAADWPYSTFHRYVRDGVYAPDWGGTQPARSMWME